MVNTMNLYLCEKQLQAEDVANALGNFSRANGFYRIGSETIVTWAKGHLLEMCKPEDYNPRFKRWDITDLPIKPYEWKKRVRFDTKDQFRVVQDLIRKASMIFIATDLDREGESIARELLERCQYGGPVKRIRITALDQDSLRSALNDARDVAETILLADAAEARQKADWLVGMNLTRLYTLLAQSMGIQETFHVGRVAIPTIALVCDRDRQIEEHVPSPYYSLKINCEYEGQSFEAKWIPPEEHCDEKKRCVTRQVRNDAGLTTKGGMGVISTLESKERKSTAPLPFDLNSLQQMACSRWGYTSKEVQKGLQALYERHKAITYPRTENRYLPSRFTGMVSDILAAIEHSGKAGEQIVSGVLHDEILSARVFDDEKVDPAHHAIIPTRQKVRLESLNKLEARLYHLISRYFVAQFYPHNVSEKTEVEIEVGENLYRATGSRTLVIGWKSVLGKNLSLIEDAGEKDLTGTPPLPNFSFGDRVTITQVIPEDHMTTPPDYFTEATLIAAMKRIGRFVDDEQLRKTLDDTAGLGTAATRAEIIDTAIKRGYLQREKHRKRITSTDKGQELISVLTRQISSPGTTALWEMRLEQVASGQVDGKHFTNEIGEWIERIISATRSAAGV
ncbi:MAG: DNA topoisomerase 3 [Candidatus Thiodiazotropha taylori]|nr:DNA topoisomerase 3 [Candidatus Thiodiazotropha taylori]